MRTVIWDGLSPGGQCTPPLGTRLKGSTTWAALLKHETWLLQGSFIYLQQGKESGFISKAVSPKRGLAFFAVGYFHPLSSFLLILFTASSTQHYATF